MNTDNNKKYRFNQIIARDVGLEEAVMFNNIYFWVEKNKEKDNHFHNGKDWMYCTVREFTERYPFWSPSQIKRILKNLEKNEYIETGNFNRFGPDKTKWYTVTEKGSLLAERENGLAEIDHSIGE